MVGQASLWCTLYHFCLVYFLKYCVTSFQVSRKGSRDVADHMTIQMDDSDSITVSEQSEPSAECWQNMYKLLNFYSLISDPTGILEKSSPENCLSGGNLSGAATASSVYPRFIKTHFPLYFAIHFFFALPHNIIVVILILILTLIIMHFLSKTAGFLCLIASFPSSSMPCNVHSYLNNIDWAFSVNTLNIIIFMSSAVKYIVKLLLEVLWPHVSHMSSLSMSVDAVKDWVLQGTKVWITLWIVEASSCSTE